MILASRRAVLNWDWTFLFLVGSLGSTILLKFANIQYLEILYSLQLMLLLAAFVARTGRAVIFRPFFRIGLAFFLFCILAISLYAVSMGRDFYIPEGVPALRQPGFVIISRLFELVLDVTAMLYLATVFRADPQKLRFTMLVYFWTGVASAVYSLISYPLDVAGIISLGSYLVTHRLRGFYNEGGPYGVYLISVFLVAIALRARRWISQRTLLITFPMLAIVLAMSDSKAAFLAIFFILFINAMTASRLSTRIAIVLLSVAVITFGVEEVDLAGQLRVYEQSSAEYESASHRHILDGNYVEGRVAGAYIVPRMIAQHPLTGIGWGNYGLVRNAPEYRGAASWAPLADEPGLGVLGLAADLGIPLLLYLLACVSLPYFFVGARHVPRYVANLALLQPVAHLFGAQLNLTYPWIATAFALGIAYASPTHLSRDSSQGALQVF